MPGVGSSPSRCSSPDLDLTTWWRDPDAFDLLVREYGKYLAAEARLLLPRRARRRPSRSRLLTRRSECRTVDMTFRAIGVCFTVRWFFLVTDARSCAHPIGAAARFFIGPDRPSPCSVYRRGCGRASRPSFLLRVLAGIRVEVRGRANIPAGAALVAAKHQSAFETFALFPLLPPRPS